MRIANNAWRLRTASYLTDSSSICVFILGLADENESVRDAALSAGHILVEHYATSYGQKTFLLSYYFVFC